MGLIGRYLYLFSAVASASPLSKAEIIGKSVDCDDQDVKTRASTSFSYDVVIYGSTPAALTAAVQIHDMNHTVAIVSPEQHIGGLTSSGLGWTDSKNGDAIGGIARDFYKEIYNHYSDSSAWTYGSRQAYLNSHIRAQPGPAIDTSKDVQWTFEPHVAEAIFEKWMSERGINIYRGEYVDRSTSGVTVSSGKIQSFRTESGKSFSAKQFIDAGYEGDLMASAGVSYATGRDAQSLYQESLAGVLLDSGAAQGTGSDRGYGGVDPWVVKGNNKSGLIYGIETAYDTLPSDFNGAADKFRLQSYMYRLCLTKEAKNKVDFPKPQNYNESQFELLLRYYEAKHTVGFTEQMMPNNKTDSNSQGEVSFDFLGGNYDLHSNPPLSYTDASYDQRKDFARAHIDWQQGVLWTLTNNDRIPAKLRSDFAEWGLAKDEFTDNNNWPYQLYVRESRRMQGASQIAQQNIQSSKGYLGGVLAGLGSYSLDSHAIRRIVLNNTIYDEGWFYLLVNNPYPIPLTTIFPQKSEATNFINPVTFSASHVAFGSVRMEPTYMILGQSAGIAAVMAIEENCAVQDIDTNTFTKKMSQYGQKTSI